jgi:hypothetical protein
VISSKGSLNCRCEEEVRRKSRIVLWDQTDRKMMVNLRKFRNNKRMFSLKQAHQCKFKIKGIMPNQTLNIKIGSLTVNLVILAICHCTATT